MNFARRAAVRVAFKPMRAAAMICQWMPSIACAMFSPGHACRFSWMKLIAASNVCIMACAAS